jgi:peroxiredoxin
MKILKSLKFNQNFLLLYSIVCLVLGLYFLLSLSESFGSLMGVIFISLSFASFLAKFEPARHWPSVLLFMVFHLLLTVVSMKSYLTGSATSYDILLLSVSVLVLLPLFNLLSYAFHEHTFEYEGHKKAIDLMKSVKTSQSQTLFDLSKNNKVLLVFVRHFGCTFCRETVSEIAKIDETIKTKKWELVYVHMSDPDFGEEFFAKYYTKKIHHISDPGRVLYKSFNLSRGTLLELFGPSTWLKGLYYGYFKGHGLGEIEGDSLQLGVFLIENGEVKFEKKANKASDVISINALPEL